MNDPPDDGSVAFEADVPELGDLVCGSALLSTSSPSDKRMFRRYLHAAATHVKKRDKAAALARQAKEGRLKELKLASRRSIARVFGAILWLSSQPVSVSTWMTPHF